MTTDTETIEPITASADGKRNSFTLSCGPTGQSMNYAACLWRQGVLSNPATKTPADWAPCNAARCAGTCTALVMREEELLAGKSIYFRARGVFRSIVEIAREWIMPDFAMPEKVKPAVRKTYSSPAPKKERGDMLDAMGSVGSFADAVTEAAKTPTSVPPPVARVIPVMPVAQAGETPLQMARRMAAERARG